MDIKQWEDKNLSHFSYAVLSESEKKVVLIDPARNPQPYYDYAKQHGAQIVAVIETHPHADFVSSHLEIAEVTGAIIYVSKLVHAQYPHQTFDEGDQIAIGKIRLSAINTPGHSPDSISVKLEHEDKIEAIFTGDTLFIGDCGRPDLREGAGNIKATRHDLAKQMYYSLREKLATLPGETKVYPAHGAGTLCGKSLSKAHSSTIAAERKTNWSLQEATEEEFVTNLLTDQPFVPLYFPYDVELNRKGAPAFNQSIKKVNIAGEISNEESAQRLNPALWMIDARKADTYKKGHLPHSINLMEEGKFETWLGSIIKPGEKFYLGGESETQLKNLIARTAAIGYEEQIEAAFVINYGQQHAAEFNLNTFKAQQENYTIIDVRNPSEVKEGKPFSNSLSIPLAEVRERVGEIPTDKPLVVHCAGGYRSAAASSLLQSTLNGKAIVFDLGEAVKAF
ncbi:Glyoxylase, beta-lactamase superfamily II [Cnuella takakiae]|uniref:Glyoxylase, beta-lactamase superfamily II n=1 Tax=Cnuella takakiae TaxID=1302690 RepID=A0A1M4SGR5_9BACT|nr:MBL fold metallo-hydrolase [Cnuella takakiae]OLY94502.1 MBL fold metallo-hydrolase [Cnuella takakiae]SHE31390.1 Glyoxylase, beta-lactamase superfamily II [Cnuella takakiae]